MEDGLGSTSLGGSLSVMGSPAVRHLLLGLSRRKLLEAPSGFPGSLPPPQWPLPSTTSEKKLEALQCPLILYSLPKSRLAISEVPTLTSETPQLSFPYSWGVGP